MLDRKRSIWIDNASCDWKCVDVVEYQSDVQRWSSSSINAIREVRYR